MNRDLSALLEQRILVFYTGITRSASSILAQQSEASASEGAQRDALKRMVELAYILRDELSCGNVDSFGAILDENWHLKKSLAAGISSSAIDDWYKAGIKAGAIGGKLLGAGSGGFLMFYAPAERHDEISNALGLRRVRLGFEPLGSRILFYNPL
jgi:D-glycero-alpha-D-manno-heptose-7-phosphate kinase